MPRYGRSLAGLSSALPPRRGARRTLSARPVRVDLHRWQVAVDQVDDGVVVVGGEQDLDPGRVSRQHVVAGDAPPYPLAFRRVLPDRKPNYGERYRAGEVISSSIAESAGNQVISKRMVKKQQMRWSPRGAHLLLQLRTRVLNDPLADDFHRWHPGFTHVPDRQGLGWPRNSPSLSRSHT